MPANTLCDPVILCATESAGDSRLLGLPANAGGCRCEFVYDVAGLEAALERQQPMLAVLDLDLDGRCMLEFCRLHPQLITEIPVAFRATHSAESFQRSMTAVRAGARDVLLGPLDETSLARLVDLVLNDLTPRGGMLSAAESLPSSTHNNAGREIIVNETSAYGMPLSVVHQPRSADPTESVSRRGASASQIVSAQTADLERHLFGISPAIASIRRVITEVARTKATILIHGESGTGKELVATAIHRLSERKGNPFIPVNMSAIPSGLAESTLFGHEKGSFTSANGVQLGWCEAADGGTLFLDEIGEMELSIQPKLLRFLQESTVQRVGSSSSRKVNVRVIAATNRDLGELVRERRMREDLYFRLHVVPIYLPPLRERTEDIAQLANLFLRRCCERYDREIFGFTEQSLDVLRAYSWPGNVRQLENVVERTVIFAESNWIEPLSLPPEVHMGVRPLGSDWLAASMATRPKESKFQGAGEAGVGSFASVPALSPIQRHERMAIIDALQRVGGHVIDAANLLGLGQATVYRKIKQYRIPHKRQRRLAK